MIYGLGTVSTGRILTLLTDIPNSESDFESDATLRRISMLVDQDTGFLKLEVSDNEVTRTFNLLNVTGSESCWSHVAIIFEQAGEHKKLKAYKNGIELFEQIVGTSIFANGNQGA